MILSRIAFAMLLGLTAPLRAEEAPAAPLDWLAGHWCGDGSPRVEETWLPPVGGALHGISRTIAHDRVQAFEFLRIAEHEGALSYLAQPGGRPATAFRWTAGGADWARFENPQHDFPTRIEYRREGDALHAEIAGPDDAGGEQSIGFRFTRCAEVALPTRTAPNAE
jgi:hypothetical protein